MDTYIFGLQRSGTNFLQTLMMANFKSGYANSKKHSWKHLMEVHPQDKIIKGLPILIIVKNPYTWIESIAFRNTVDWLSKQKKYPADDVTDVPENIKVGKPGKLLNPIALAKTWKEHYENWIFHPPDYISSKSMVIKYEELLEEKSRNHIMETINTRYGFNADKVKNPWHTPARGKISQSKDYTIDREKYYLEGKPSSLTPIQIQAINTVLDAEFMSKTLYNQIL